jgi:hypothetical protein
VVRCDKTICHTRDRAVYHARGVSLGVIAAITTVEHGSLELGRRCSLAARWEALAPSGSVYRPRPRIHAAYFQCCGLGPPGVLELAIRNLPRRAKPGLRRMARHPRLPTKVDGATTIVNRVIEPRASIRHGQSLTLAQGHNMVKEQARSMITTWSHHVTPLLLSS